MAGRHVTILYVCLLTVLSPLSAAAQQERPRAIEDFSENSLIIASAKYLGATAESMAEVIDRIFSRYGKPSAVIRGEEISVSVMLGRTLWPWHTFIPRWPRISDLLARTLGRRRYGRDRQ